VARGVGVCLFLDFNVRITHGIVCKFSGSRRCGSGSGSGSGGRGLFNLFGHLVKQTVIFHSHSACRIFFSDLSPEAVQYTESPIGVPPVAKRTNRGDFRAFRGILRIGHHATGGFESQAQRTHKRELSRALWRHRGRKNPRDSDVISPPFLSTV
jgi:hypothetical protein